MVLRDGGVSPYTLTKTQSPLKKLNATTEKRTHLGLFPREAAVCLQRERGEERRRRPFDRNTSRVKDVDMRGTDLKELTKSVHLRLKADMHTTLIELARADERDLGSMIRTLVAEALKARVEKCH